MAINEEQFDEVLVNETTTDTVETKDEVSALKEEVSALRSDMKQLLAMMSKVNNSCNNMDTHITFVESVYSKLAYPLNCIKSFVENYFGTVQTESLPLTYDTTPQLTHDIE